MITALLSGSNYRDFMPENARMMPTDRLMQNLSRRQFRMGFFTDKTTGKEVFTIGVLNEGDNGTHSEFEGTDVENMVTDVNGSGRVDEYTTSEQ